MKRKENRMEFKRASAHDIRIKHTANNGMIVKVGCCEVCFNDYKMMLEALAEYYDHPGDMEQEYNHMSKNDAPQPVDDCQEDCCESAPMGNTLAAGRSLGPVSSINEGRERRR